MYFAKCAPLASSYVNGTFLIQAQAAKKEKDKLKNALKKEKKIIRTTCNVRFMRKTRNTKTNDYNLL